MNVWGHRLKGWLFVLSLALGCALLIGPTLQKLYGQQDQMNRTRELIERHQLSLAKPSPPNPYQSYGVFISDGDTRNTTLVADVQTALIDVLQNSDARLIDLRQEDDDVSVSGLVGIEFLLNYEGDLRATLNALVKISEQTWPILIEDFSLRAQGPDQRPGLRVLVTLRLKIWIREQV